MRLFLIVENYMIYNILVLFLLVFCFPILGPLNSAYIAVAIALLKICFCGRISFIAQLLINKYIKTLVWSSLGITILCGVWTFLLEADDFSLTAAFFSLFIGLWMVVIVIASLNYSNYDEDFYERLLVDVFVIQACISIASFVSPSIREVVHHFQFTDEAEKSEAAYAGFRGLALSGRLFFEFAATCGLIAFVQLKRIIDNPTLSFLEYIKLFLIIICGFFAGRTSMIGFFFGIAYLFLRKGSIRPKLKMLCKLIITLFSCIGACLIVAPAHILDFFTQHVLPWVFDLFIKFHESGSTKDSASFNHLNEMYRNVIVTKEEWIYGSGRFMSKFGGYYKYVDGGYIRHLLYWGVIGSIINMLYGLLYFIKPYVKSITRNQHIYILLLLVYTFFIHYKGDIATTSRFYHVPLVILMLPFVFNPTKLFYRGTNRHCNSMG